MASPKRQHKTCASVCVRVNEGDVIDEILRKHVLIDCATQRGNALGKLKRNAISQRTWMGIASKLMKVTFWGIHWLTIEIWMKECSMSVGPPWMFNISTNPKVKPIYYLIFVPKTNTFKKTDVGCLLFLRRGEWVLGMQNVGVYSELELVSVYFFYFMEAVQKPYCTVGNQRFSMGSLKNISPPQFDQLVSL